MIYNIDLTKQPEPKKKKTYVKKSRKKSPIKIDKNSEEASFLESSRKIEPIYKNLKNEVITS